MVARRSGPVSSRFANSPAATEHAFGPPDKSGDRSSVLVIAPHPDDESIGCGGAIIRHADRGDRVHVVFLTSGERWRDDLTPLDVWAIREPEAEQAARVLGVARTSFLRNPDWDVEGHSERALADVVAAIEQEGPAVVYAPHLGEWHPDHRAAWKVAVAAAARCGLEATAVRGYEVWTPLVDYDVVADISDVMERKLEAIGQYHSQLSAFDYLRAARGLGGYRGALVSRTEYAEVFGSARR